VARISCLDLLLQICNIFGFAGGVGDDVEGLGPKACDDRIVYDTAGGWMEEAGERGAVGLEGRGGGGSYLFKKGSSTRTGEAMLDPGGKYSVTGSTIERSQAYICPTSNRLALSLVHL
jgi:hypothetical protein